MSFDLSEHDSEEVMHEINMTPLVDVMLVLLIIFIITLPVVQHAVKVELPKASSSIKQAPAAEVQLSIDAQGQFFVGREAIPADALERTLRQLASQDSPPQLYIRGDQSVRYAAVVQAMSAAQRAGLTRIGFVTEAQQP